MLALGDSKQHRLIYTCFMMYTSVYLAKLNYNALLVEILGDLGGTRSAAGLVSSFFFFSYGIGQVVSGFLAKRFNEKYVVTGSLFGSALCNLSMSLAPNVSVMKYIWLLNGIIMSTLWCSVIKVQGKYISAKNLPRSLSLMGLTTPLGTALNYGACALIAAVTTWRVSFWLAAGLMTFMAVLWFVTLSDVERSAGPVSVTREKGESSPQEPDKVSEPKSVGTAVAVGIGIIYIAVMVTQFSRDGLNTWVPSILYEVYNLPTTLSIALTLLLPLLSSLSNFALVALERKCKYFVVLSIVFVGCAALFMAVLVACYRLNSAVVTMVCFIVVCASCSGMANIATNHLPLYYRDRFDPGMLAGLAQGFSYLGSTVSTYTLGFVADKGGWFNVFLLLTVVILAALIMCVIYKAVTREFTLAQTSRICRSKAGTTTRRGHSEGGTTEES